MAPVRFGRRVIIGRTINLLKHNQRCPSIALDFRYRARIARVCIKLRYIPTVP